MLSFLEQLAQYISSKYENNLNELCIVFPNRRAGVFMKHSIGKVLSRTSWLPEIFSIEDFIVNQSKVQIIDPVFLQFEIYEVHRIIEKNKAQSFDEFLGWGQTLLQDFNEIDHYLVDAEKLYSHLSDTKAIQLWHPDGKPLTDFEKKYLNFYRSLSKYYFLLKERLTTEKTIYQGLAYRGFYENLNNYIAGMGWKKIIFAGFNALTPAEEGIVFSLHKVGLADLVWDSDQYYLSNPDHEAGMFLKNYIQKIGIENFNFQGNFFARKDRNDKIIGVPKNIAQVKYTSQLIQELSTSNVDPSDTVVVLNDERMLIPLLNSIPDKISHFNISMGLSLSQTPLFDFFDAILILRENAFKHGDSTNTLKFYYKDIESVLSHPFFSLILKNKSFDDDKNEIHHIQSEFKSQNRAFFYPEQLNWLQKKLPKDLKTLFNIWDDTVVSLFIAFENIVTYLKNIFLKNKEFQLEQEYLFYLSTGLIKIKNLIQKYPHITDISSFRKLFIQVCKGVKVPLIGEPLKGIQIMGMLETRALDFKNVIMLSVNEGVLPKGKTQQSFIPYEIKKQYGLPTYQSKNAVFSYHFYRLLQRADKSFLIYNTEVDDFGAGDKSRFISQLLYELPQWNQQKINHDIYFAIPDKPIYSGEINISKTSDILKKIIDLSENGFSPTALNSYIQCPVKFYFQYVVGIREMESIEETIESYTLGTVIHEVLQELFKPYINTTLLPENIQSMFDLVDELTYRTYRKHYKGGEINFGKNLLAVEASKGLIRNFLKTEKTFIENIKDKPITILDLEKEFSRNIQLDETTIKLKGTADRIDKIDETIRIIDYKTGFVKDTQLSFTDFDNLFENNKDKAFQVLFYTWLFSEHFNYTNIQAGIISLRNLNSGFLPVKIDKNELRPDDIDKFEILLNKIIRDLFDIKSPFIQTEDEERCIYCPYIDVCNRR